MVQTPTTEVDVAEITEGDNSTQTLSLATASTLDATIPTSVLPTFPPVSTSPLCIGTSSQALEVPPTRVTMVTPTSRLSQMMPPIPTSTTAIPTNIYHSALVKRRTKSPKPEKLLSFEAILPMLQTLDPFHQAFPSPVNRELFHHFLQSTSRIIVALDNPHHNNNPFVSVALPLALSEGCNIARDGARHALLSLTAAHQHHQLRQSSQQKSLEMLQASDREKRLAMASMISDMTVNFQADIDFLLATCMILKTRDVSGTVVCADHRY